MMDKNILLAYQFLLENNSDVEGIKNMEEKKFLENKELLNYGLGLINNLRELFLNLGIIAFFSSEVLNKKNNELSYLCNYFLNGYGGINGYLIYDFLINEYSLILDEFIKILGL